MSTPKISVLMPAYNAQRHLGPAIDSILGQTHANLELIVVDDGSTDATGEILRGYAAADARVRPIHQANQGIVGALNRALAEATSSCCARMDADDLSMPDRLAAQLAFMKAHPDVVVLGGQCLVIDEDGDPVMPLRVALTHQDITSSLLREKSHGGRTHLVHPAVMFRTDVARRIGGYRQDFIWAEDRDFFLRMGEAGQLANLDRTVLHYRQASGSVTSTRSEQQQESAYRAIVEARLRRNLPAVPEASIRWAPSQPASAAQNAVHVARMAAQHGYRSTASKHLHRALRAAPMSRDVWEALLLHAAPQRVLKLLRALKCAFRPPAVGPARPRDLP